jgi:hypothetical protein
MAAQLYANTQLALALYEVLQELVEEGKVPEQLAVATLAQVRLAAALGGMQQLLLERWFCSDVCRVACRMQLIKVEIHVCALKTLSLSSK